MLQTATHKVKYQSARYDNNAVGNLIQNPNILQVYGTNQRTLVSFEDQYWLRVLALIFVVISQELPLGSMRKNLCRILLAFKSLKLEF